MLSGQPAEFLRSQFAASLSSRCGGDSDENVQQGQASTALIERSHDLLRSQDLPALLLKLCYMTRLLPSRFCFALKTDLLLCHCLFYIPWSHSGVLGRVILMITMLTQRHQYIRVEKVKAGHNHKNSFFHQRKKYKGRKTYSLQKKRNNNNKKK